MHHMRAHCSAANARPTPFVQTCRWTPSAGRAHPAARPPLAASRREPVDNYLGEPLKVRPARVAAAAAAALPASRRRTGAGLPASQSPRVASTGWPVCVGGGSLVQVEVQELLTPPERAPQPLWSTFCGVTGGMWVGVVGAYRPDTGQPEAIALDGTKGVLLMTQCCIEGRSDDGGIVRWVYMARLPRSAPHGGSSCPGVPFLGGPPTQECPWRWSARRG
jgi:hypothetical protein